MADTTQPQVEEVNENLVDAQPQAEPEAQPQATEPEPQAPTESTETTPYLEVQVIEEINGKRQKNDKKLTKDEAIIYAQKGFDYDHVKDRLQSIQSELERAKKAAEVFDTIANETGKTYDDVIAQTLRQRLEAKAKKEGKTLGQVEAEISAEQNKTENAALKAEKEAFVRHAQERAEFEAENPDVDVRTLPQELLNEWLNDGVPLTKAYRMFKYDETQKELAQAKADLAALQERNKKMEDQQKTAAINAENAATAPGKLGEAATAETPITQEWIEKASPDELDKNHSKVWAYLTGAKK